MTRIFFAASLFLWFATANIILPFLAWPGQALVFPVLPIKHRAGYSVVFVPAMAAVAAWFIFRFLQQESATMRQRRRERNEYLPSIIKELVSTAAPQKSSTELEIQPEELSQLRHILKIAMQDQDDWFVPLSNFSVIDQFQTASIRYQLCEIIYVLALANKIYTPSFRGGYLQRAQKKVIYKYCQKKVLNYWKWECLWGKLSTNYEPVKKDNIMLTGFLLLAISLYESATGDHTFSEENALELVIDNSHRYRHSAKTLAQALMENFSISSYCLYACEPNWIYTFCNLNGINSLLAHDANTGRRDVELVRASFHKALVEEFLDESGSAHPIRSSPTGLRLPNIVGAANEFSVSCLAGPNFPDLSLRSYAIARHEYMEFDSQCKLSFKNIQNGDMLDPGNYGSSMALLYASSLMAAHEHGDNEVARQITTMIDYDQSLLRTEKDGFVWYEGISLFMKCQLLRARLWLRSGWSRFMQPSSDAVQRGPCLTDVNFEEAMVAKAISYTGDDLDLVLYPGTEAMSTWISIKNLKPSSDYMIKDVMRFASNEQGEARISVQLDGRTAIQIVPALS
ncbi:SCO2- involved in stability of Cox1p and Cox2p [Pyrenophora seminiperda CCB06]|uniref:SCO2-involved in stability of Cox1p and Cox2p n=1 Tax=Pyrenophora seminiperda CCB06 TaxID=1302712 RepID=A0A3M7LXX1_9PLEO|nr:SCO2- involved in stability of Cox1p and Cox2p [Pyrenophora seminiperda CCB06]